MPPDVQALSPYAYQKAFSLPLAQFAISGMKAEDFVLNTVASLLVSMAQWPQWRLGHLFRCDLEDAAEHITTHGLMAMFDNA